MENDRRRDGEQERGRRERRVMCNSMVFQLSIWKSGVNLLMRCGKLRGAGLGGRSGIKFWTLCLK